VTQDFYRWPFTARVNVEIGRPEAPCDDDLLHAAAEYAGADETVAALPRGWDTLLARGYKGGHQISGSQWQRLGIARARHRDARILVVDEPTSALDAEAEQRVFDRIQGLAAEGQTIVLITHRLHSVHHADAIYVLEHGRVAEHGTFDGLMRPDADGPGLFRRMYLVQAEQYRVDGQVAALPAQQGRPAADPRSQVRPLPEVRAVGPDAGMAGGAVRPGGVVMTEDLQEMGPADYLIVEFPGNRMTGEGFPLLIDLVERGVIRIIDLAFVREDADGSVAALELRQFGDGVDLTMFEGASSGLLGQGDLDDAGAALEPGNSAAVLVYENAWAAPPARALRRGGAQMVASGRVPVPALLASLDATEVTTPQPSGPVTA
jgi:hypothetical protein